MERRRPDWDDPWAIAGTEVLVETAETLRRAEKGQVDALRAGHSDPLHGDDAGEALRWALSSFISGSNLSPQLALQHARLPDQYSRSVGRRQPKNPRKVAGSPEDD